MKRFAGGSLEASRFALAARYAARFARSFAARFARSFAARCARSFAARCAGGSLEASRFALAARCTRRFAARCALILAAILLCSGVAAAADEDDIDELLYSDLGRQRNTQEGLTVLMRQVAADLIAKPGDYRLLWIYAALNYFQGDFYSVNPDDKKKYYTLCREYADQAVKTNPEGIAGHYWLGIGLAKWAESNGVLFSLFSADDIMGEMTTVIDLNPSYLTGIPFAVRASVYAYAPGVISVGDWDKARSDIAQAFIYGKDNRSNYLVVADIYIYWGEWENAKKMVDEGLALPYDSRMPLEENDCIAKLNLRKTKVEAELAKRQKK